MYEYAGSGSLHSIYSIFIYIFGSLSIPNRYEMQPFFFLSEGIIFHCMFLWFIENSLLCTCVSLPFTIRFDRKHGKSQFLISISQVKAGSKQRNKFIIFGDMHLIWFGLMKVEMKIFFHDFASGSLWLTGRSVVAKTISNIK